MRLTKETFIYIYYDKYQGQKDELFIVKEIEKYFKKIFQKKLTYFRGNSSHSYPTKDNIFHLILSYKTQKKFVCDSFEINKKGNSLWIKEENKRSLLYGVYYFLQKYCNCRWISPGEDKIEKKIK